jgi:hypothetical protein
MNPTKPRIDAGRAGIAGGVNWRVIPGHKAPGDLVIQWYVNERWIPVSLDTIFVAIDLICQNEDELYPFPAKGGQMVITALQEARRLGFEHATGWLHLQRQNREERGGRGWMAS